MICQMYDSETGKKCKDEAVWHCKDQYWEKDACDKHRPKRFKDDERYDIHTMKFFKINEES